MKKEVNAPKLPKIVAVDFDGTLVSDKFPDIGEPNKPLISLMRAVQALDVRVILWTCRTGEMLDAAVDMLEGQGLVCDAVNENLPEVQALYGGDTRKVFADLYIDDKAVPVIQSPGYWLDRIDLSRYAVSAMEQTLKDRYCEEE